MRKILLSIWVFLIASSMLSAQQQLVIDSLESILTSTKYDSVKVITMQKLWWEYLFSKPEVAKTYLRKGLDLSREIRFVSGEALILRSFGATYYHAGDYDQACQYSNEALAIYEKTKNQVGIANSLATIGMSYLKQGSYVKSLDIHLRVLRIGEQLRDTTLRAASLNNIGQIYANQGDTEQAMNYYQQALIFHRYQKSKLSMASIYNSIASIELDRNEIYKALSSFSLALDLFKELNNQKGIADVLNNTGSAYIKQRKYSQAIKNCTQALEIRKELNDKYGMAQCYVNIAIAYRLLGLSENAFNNALQGYEIAKELNIKKIIKEASIQIAEIYAFQNNYQKALEYYQIYDIAKDSLFNQENIKQLSDMRAKYEAQTKEQEISKLRIEQNARKSEIRQKTIISYSLVAILLMSLFFSGLVFYNYRAKQKINIALEAKNMEVNETLNQLRSAQSQLIHSEKMASLGQLTAGIAHEINNPLNFIYAGISALEHCMNSFYDITDDIQKLMTEEDRDKIINYVAHMKQSRSLKEYDEIKTDIDALIKDIKIGAVRTTDIVKGLRNFSRLDDGKPKYGDIHNDLDAALMLLRSKLMKNITVSKKYGEKIPEIAALHGQLNQVFTNIIANAIQAMEPVGGKLSILTKTVIIQGKNHVSISIKDTGAGMSANVRAKVFEPFFTTKEIGEGTGLGLSISYGIIKNHQGNIEVFSEIDKGTEFVVTLPVVLE